MANKVTVDLSKLKKDITRLQNKLTGIADRAVNEVVSRRQSVYMSFDEVEVTPYATAGQIVVTGTDDMNVELFLERETQKVMEETTDIINKGIKEALR